MRHTIRVRVPAHNVPGVVDAGHVSFGRIGIIHRDVLFVGQEANPSVVTASGVLVVGTHNLIGVVVVSAIGNSKCADDVSGRKLTYWQDTAILLVWDDWGGWYDHEGPSILGMPIGDYQYGFRVPFIFVSAYTSPQYVDNNRNDFGSILRFIENNFSGLGLTEGELGFADSRSTTNLTGFLNVTNPPRLFVTIPAPKAADFFIKDLRAPEPPDND